MGCWDKTCGLTNTAISENEQCVIITFNEGADKSTDHIMESLHRQFVRNKGIQESEYLRELHTVHEASLLSKHPDDFKKGYFEPVNSVFYGTYNEYGGVNEEERIPESGIDESSHFFHVWAVETLFGSVIGTLIEKPIEFARDLYHNLFLLRKGPFDSVYSAPQSENVSDMKLSIKMNLAVNDYLQKRIDLYYEKHGKND